METREGDLGLTALLLRLRTLNPARYQDFVSAVQKTVALEEQASFAISCLHDVLASLPPVESAS